MTCWTLRQRRQNLDDRGADQDDEQRRQDEEDHRHRQDGRQPGRLLLGLHHPHVAELAGQHPQRLGQRRAVFLGLGERVDQAADRGGFDTLGQVLQGVAAVGQKAQFDGGQTQLVGQFGTVRPDFPGDPGQGRLQAEPRLGADHEQVQGVRQTPLDLLSAVGDGVAHEDRGTEGASGDSRKGAQPLEGRRKAVRHHGGPQVDEYPEPDRHRQPQAEKDGQGVRAAPACPGQKLGGLAAFLAAGELQALEQAAHGDHRLGPTGGAGGSEELGAQFAPALGVGPGAGVHRVVGQQGPVQDDDDQEIGQRRNALDEGFARQAHGKDVGRVHMSKLTIFIITPMPIPRLVPPPASRTRPKGAVNRVMM